MGKGTHPIGLPIYLDVAANLYDRNAERYMFRRFPISDAKG
jgi:hypothetical protein